MSEGDHNPTKKESVETVVPYTLGKVCNWDNVDDKPLLRQIQMNSDDKVRPLLWNLQIPDINFILNQKERKVWQALVLINQAFVESLIL